MAKPAKPKRAAPVPTGAGKKPSRARHHGRTFCKRCTRKISFGRAFCNNACYIAYHEAGWGSR